MNPLSLPARLLLLAALALGCAKPPADPQPPAPHQPRALPPFDGQLVEGRLLYRRYDVPQREPDGGWSGRGLPLAVALEDSGDAWLLGEFHTHMQHARAAGPAVPTRRIEIPHHPDARPFAGLYGVMGQNSVLGESALVDDRGHVWLSQGGGHLIADGTNHSRVVSYEPDSGSFRAYNLPGDRNEALGLHWDERRRIIWVAESGMHAVRPPAGAAPAEEPPIAGALVAFDPESTPHDERFLWDQPPDALLCPEPTPNPSGCYARFELPEGALAPAHIVSDTTGALWFTLFWGRAIGRLDPETGESLLYPLEPEIGTSPRAGVVGPGAWAIAISPDAEYVVWSEFFDSTVARLPISRAFDPECRALRDGRNPCIEEMRVPGADLERQQVHSVAYDRFGNLWFTQSAVPSATGIHSSIGFVSADWSRIRMLAPFGRGAEIPTSYTGIAIDPKTGDIWVAEFLAPALGRLTPVDPDVDPSDW